MNKEFPLEMEGKEGIEALFLYATEGILVVDDRGTIVRANPSLEKLFRYNSGELIGKTIETLVPKRLAARHAEHRHAYHGDPHARSMGKGLDLYGLRKDGTEIPVEISLSPYSTEDGNFVIAFIVDITLRKEAEEKMKNYSSELEKQVANRTLILQEAISELEKTKRDLHQALEKERELNELKSRFVSMASHEFRTPLTTMMSSLSLVSRYTDKGDKTNQEKHIGKIKTSINNLTDILDDFLSLSKLEEGKIENNPELFAIEPFIREIIAEMQPLAKPEQEISYTHTGKDEVRLDTKILKNVLFNLISNAIKFSGEKGKIEVSSSTDKNNVSLTIRDNGIGIPKEEQPYLFGRFFRGRNATHIQGTGLGLHIVTRYIDLMNARLDFSSEENKGTTFTITIPQPKTAG